MKKAKLFFTVLALSAIGNQSRAQFSSVGIGMTTPPTDAALHINNYVGLASDCSTPLTNKPGIRIEDYANINSGLYTMRHNLFEIYHQSTTCPYSLGGSTLQPVFVINTADYYSGHATDVNISINKAPTTYTLDIGGSTNTDGILNVGSDASINGNLTAGGNAMIRGNAIVNGNETINGGQLDMTMPGDTWRNINANSGIGGLTISSGSGGAYQQFHAIAEGADPGAMSIVSGTGGTGTTFLSYDNLGTWNVLMRIKPNGQVAIGQDIIYPTENLPSVGQYNLYVSKGILTEKVKVALRTDVNWADYVFDKSYNLMPLTEVESFVKTNKHLPQIPSASDVKSEGIDVAAMDAKLLQKIEELTLYVIQQQKEIDELKKMGNK